MRLKAKAVVCCGGPSQGNIEIATWEQPIVPTSNESDIPLRQWIEKQLANRRADFIRVERA